MAESSGCYKKRGGLYVQAPFVATVWVLIASCTYRADDPRQTIYPIDGSIDISRDSTSLSRQDTVAREAAPAEPPTTDGSLVDWAPDVVTVDLDQQGPEALDAVAIGDDAAANTSDGGVPAIEPPCKAPSQLCPDDNCHDLRTDNANCGSCGHACSGGQVCTSGTCTCMLGTTLCGDCTQLDRDPFNCGSCGHVCSFPNAHAYCEGGSCHLGGCAAGHGNPDGVETNGCECSVTNGGVEICDGIDNDCNGLTDFTLTSGLPVATCKCQEQILTVTSATGECGERECTVPQCPITSAGQEMGIDYSLGACTQPLPWAQCAVQSVYLNAFDADHGNTGLLEISLCVAGLDAGEKMNGVGIYYGAYPGRKHLVFFSTQELSQGVSNGCYTKHFKPSDVICPPEAGLPATCGSGCENGVWGSGNHPECVLGYDNVPL